MQNLRSKIMDGTRLCNKSKSLHLQDLDIPMHSTQFNNPRYVCTQIERPLNLLVFGNSDSNTSCQSVKLLGYGTMPLEMRSYGPL